MDCTLSRALYFGFVLCPALVAIRADTAISIELGTDTMARLGLKERQTWHTYELQTSICNSSRRFCKFLDMHHFTAQLS